MWSVLNGSLSVVRKSFFDPVGCPARPQALSITDWGKLLNFSTSMTFFSLIRHVALSNESQAARRNSDEAIEIFCWYGTADL